jgi:hypothetical protein
MRRLVIVVSALMMISTIAKATHLRGGEITIRRVDCVLLSYLITVTVYTDLESPVWFGGPQSEGLDVLDFGDGNRFIIPETQAQNRPDLGENVGVASYTVRHTYFRPGEYVVSYREPNRNMGVINMTNSVETPFYTEAKIVVAPTINICRPEIIFLTPPIFTVVSGVPTTISLSAASINGYRLRYTLVSCKSDRGQTVADYVLPETVSINPNTGLFSWDGTFLGSPAYGEFSFAVKAEQFIEDVSVGYTIRDFQIVIEDGVFQGSFTDNIELNEYERIYVEEQDSKQFKVFAETQSGTITSMQLFSEKPGLVSMEVYDSVATPSTIKVGTLTLTNNEIAQRDMPYVFTVRTKFDLLYGSVVSLDRTYMLFTKDVLLPEIITGTEEDNTRPILYPNPSIDRLTITCEPNCVYVIYDATGKPVMRGETIGDIDVSNLAQGSYLLSVSVGKSKKGSTIYRFVKS